MMSRLDELSPSAPAAVQALAWGAQGTCNLGKYLNYKLVNLEFPYNSPASNRLSLFPARRWDGSLGLQLKGSG